jgi:hypothetical protein
MIDRLLDVFVPPIGSHARSIAFLREIEFQVMDTAVFSIIEKTRVRWRGEGEGKCEGWDQGSVQRPLSSFRFANCDFERCPSTTRSPICSCSSHRWLNLANAQCGPRWGLGRWNGCRERIREQMQSGILSLRSLCSSHGTLKSFEDNRRIPSIPNDLSGVIRLEMVSVTPRDKSMA